MIYGQLKTLQEAELSLLPRSDCVTFKKTLKVDTRIEMCAGHKKFRKIDAYRRLPYYKTRSNGKIFRRLRMRTRKRDFDVRYDKAESCNWDSGTILPDIVGNNTFLFSVNCAGL